MDCWGSELGLFSRFSRKKKKRIDSFTIELDYFSFSFYLFALHMEEQEDFLALVSLLWPEVSHYPSWC